MVFTLIVVLIWSLRWWSVMLLTDIQSRVVFERLGGIQEMKLCLAVADEFGDFWRLPEAHTSSRPCSRLRFCLDGGHERPYQGHSNDNIKPI
ncbi:unnamed protein product [Amoebophrya sp. A25]|nr:unnamed protein product [Amoebophrya sp. A25]|eukprot:GSA25T00018733001.1